MKWHDDDERTVWLTAFAAHLGAGPPAAVVHADRALVYVREAGLLDDGGVEDDLDENAMWRGEDHGGESNADLEVVIWRDVYCAAVEAGDGRPDVAARRALEAFRAEFSPWPDSWRCGACGDVNQANTHRCDCGAPKPTHPEIRGL